jgi:hypothetical protein
MISPGVGPEPFSASGSGSGDIVIFGSGSDDGVISGSGADDGVISGVDIGSAVDLVEPDSRNASHNNTFAYMTLSPTYLLI